MIFFRKTYNLNKDNITTARDEICQSFREKVGKREDKSKSVELLMEEMLLAILGGSGNGETVSNRSEVASDEKATGVRLEVIAHKGFLTGVWYEFKTIGDRNDPFADIEDGMRYSRKILQRYCNSPSYTYKEKTRTGVISFGVALKPRKNAMLIKIFVAIALAFATKYILTLTSPDVASTVATDIVYPIFTKMTAVISAIATPLVFLSVISGIVGIGSASQVGNIGKKFLKNMMLTYLIGAIAFTGFAFIFYDTSNALSSSGGGVIGQIMTLVLDMVPSNLIACFAEGNDLQVIVLAIFVGIVLLAIGTISEEVTDVIDFFSDLVNKMMMIACKLLPFIVYAGVLQLLLADLSSLKDIYKMLIAFVATIIIIVASVFVRTAARVKVSPFKLFKYQVKTLVINLTTSSQVAALPENSRCCKEDFGLPEKMVDFVLPIGIVTYMPNGAAFLGLITWAISDIAGTPLDLSTIIKLAFVATVLAIAAPPIPGSALVVTPILFSATGLSNDYFSLAIIIGTLLGYFFPALNGYCLQLEMLITGEQLGFVSEETKQRLRAHKG